MSGNRHFRNLCGNGNIALLADRTVVMLLSKPCGNAFRMKYVFARQVSNCLPFAYWFQTNNTVKSINTTIKVLNGTCYWHIPDEIVIRDLGSGEAFVPHVFQSPE